MYPRGLVWVLVMSALWLAGCSALSPAGPATAPSPVSLGGVDLSDPNVGGGVGYDDPTLPTSGPGESERPLPAIEDGSPRQDAPTIVAAAPTMALDPTPPPTAPVAVVITATPGPPTPTPVALPEVSPTPPTEPPPVAEQAPATHVVAAGETLNQIATLYGLTWSALAELNGITNPDRIEAGQVLRLPQPEGAAAQPPAEGTAPATPEPPRVHIVGPGDSLYGISQLYGVSWVEIAEANGLITANQIVVGQALKIPVSRPGPTPSFTHQVRPGESLFRIALQYGVPAARLAEENGLQPPYVIYPGQQLVIPMEGN